MIDYIKGELTELTPTYAVIEAAGVGYEINIALSTYTALVGHENEQNVRLYTFEAIREDAHDMYGFMQKAERELFLLLTSVSGIGPNTARLIMSGYTPAELRQIIATGNSAALGKIKGLGSKTSQRIIVDLKDKVLKVELGNAAIVDMFPAESAAVVDNETKTEAVSALSMLGFSAAASGKVVDKILKSDPAMSVEAVIRQALKML